MICLMDFYTIIKRELLKIRIKKDDSDKEEVLENTQTYSESVKEILDNGKETLGYSKTRN